MFLNNRLTSISTAILLAVSPGLVERVNAHDTKPKKPIKVPAPKPDLKTLQQWRVPSTNGVDNYNGVLDTSFRVPGKPSKSTAAWYYKVDGNIIIINTLNGVPYGVFVCSAPPNSRVSVYHSEKGDGFFENMSPEPKVPCNPEEYKK